MEYKIQREQYDNPELIRKLATLHTSVPAEWTPGWTPEKDLTESLIQGEISKLSRFWGKPNQLVLVVYDSNESMIGYHWATCRPFEERIPGMPWYGVQIHGLWVHPEWRRKGIALQLKTHLEDWAREVGCGMITTQAHLDNGLGVKELNEKLGYKVVRYVMQKRL